MIVVYMRQWVHTAVALLSVAGWTTAHVNDAFYDCQMRQMASDYTKEIIVALQHGWTEARAVTAISLVNHGLKLEECNASLSPTRGEHRRSVSIFNRCVCCTEFKVAVRVRATSSRQPSNLLLWRRD